MSTTILKIDLDFHPRPWQAETYRNIGRHRFSTLAVHRRGGKTLAAVMLLVSRALQHKGGDGRYAYIAPFLKQAKAVAWDYLQRYAGKIPGHKINQAELSVTLPGGSQIRLYGADNFEALRGLYFDGLVLDEVAQIGKPVWEEILRPTLSDRHGWGLFIGTPNGLNLFSELYGLGSHTPDWFSRKWTCYETDALPPDEIATLRSEMSEPAFAREMLCDFSSSGADSLLSLTEVEDASRRHYNLDQYQHAGVILGGDVARYGDDSSVFFRRQGLASFIPRVISGADTMDVAHVAAEEIAAHRPDVVCIDAGYNPGVIDVLRRSGQSVIEIQFGGKAFDARYADKRSEMAFELAKWIREGGAIPNDPMLKVELCALRYEVDRKGRLRLLPKDDVKRQIGRSPDRADALCCCFAFPVPPKIRVGRCNTVYRHDGGMGVTFEQAAPRNNGDFDPFREAWEELRKG